MKQNVQKLFFYSLRVEHCSTMQFSVIIGTLILIAPTPHLHVTAVQYEVF